MGKIHDALRKAEEMRGSAPAAVARETDTEIEVRTTALDVPPAHAPAKRRSWFPRRKAKSPAPTRSEARVAASNCTTTPFRRERETQSGSPMSPIVDGSCCRRTSTSRATRSNA